MSQRKNNLGMSVILNEKIQENEIDGVNRIRVGTFNVNGKSPTQDLSTWLGNEPPSSHGNNNEQKHFVPPLRELSPLSLSEKQAGKASPLD